MKNIFELVISAVAVFASYGGWKIGAQYFGKLKSSTKNENLKLALGFAQDACLFGQTFSAPGVVQQQAAVIRFKKRLADNGIAKNFTDEQAIALVQRMFTVLKANGQLDAVKKVADKDEVAEAEKVIEGSNEVAASPSETAE